LDTLKKPTKPVTMAITNGEIDLGTWEQIFYCEFDGQRRKRVWVPRATVLPAILRLKLNFLEFLAKQV